MWIYQKNLQYPIRVGKPNLRIAKLLYEAYGGQFSSLSNALRYFNQRYTMPNNSVIALLTDIGTEELAHIELVATMIYKLTKDATPKQLRAAGLGGSFVGHGKSLFYQNAIGVPWTAAYIQAIGDPIADMEGNIAAESSSIAMFQHLIDLTDDEDLADGLKFLREREISHSFRFREALEILRFEQDSP